MEDNQQIPANGETDFEQHYGDNGDQLGMAEHTEMQQEMPEQGMESAELSGQHAGSCEDEESRKIFVGGLSWETTVKDMKDYFSKFGEVTDATLKTDQNTGRSRGFGFVTFVDSTCVNRVIEQTQHTLHGKNIDPKRAKARPGREPVKKIFVGGLDPEVPEEEIRQHFSKYGKVEEVELPFDRSKNQRRFFCFVSFDTGEAVDALCQESEKHVLGGKNVDVRKATIQRNEQGYFGGQGGGGGGGGGGFRGGRGGRGGGSWGGGEPRGRGGRGGRGRGGYGGGYGGGWGGGTGGYNDYYNQGYGGGGYGGGGYDYNQGGYGGGYDYYGQGGGYGGYGGQGGGQGGGYGGSGGGGSGGGSYGSGPQSGGGFKAKTPRGGGGYHPY